MVAVENGQTSLRYTIGSVITAMLIVTLLAISSYFGYAAYRLTIDYPGLNDPSPNVDGYWPAVVNLIYKVFAATSALLAIIIGAIWGYYSVNRRTKLKAMQNTEAAATA